MAPIIIAYYQVVIRDHIFYFQDYPRYGNGHVYISMYQGDEQQQLQESQTEEQSTSLSVIPVGSPNSSQNDDVENNDENASDDGTTRNKGSKKVRKPRTIYR